MKRILLLLVAITTFIMLVGCTKDENSTPTDLVVGSWKLLKTEHQDADGTVEMDYSEEDVAYTFTENGKFNVVGNNIVYQPGEYSYAFSEEYIENSTNEEKKLLVAIKDVKYVFKVSSNLMELDHSYTGGKKLVFERK